MSNHLAKYKGNTWLTHKPWITGLAAFLLIAAVAFYIINQHYRIQRNEEREAAIAQLETTSDRLQQSLQYSFTAAQMLAMTIDRNGNPRNFDSIAAYILENNHHIDALELVPGGIIKYIYPEQGNRAAVGYDILSDSSTNREAIKAIAKKELFFAGPFQLRQGGTGVVGRLPVFINQEFWGFSAVIIRLPTLLKAAGIDNNGTSGYYYQLSKVNPNTGKEEYFLPLRKFSAAEYKVAVSIPHGEWKLSIVPVNGYKSLVAIIPLSLLALALAAIGGFFVTYTCKAPARLQRLVAARTEELEDTVEKMQKADQRIRESELKYRTLVEQATDGIFIADLKGNFMVVNPAGCKLSQYTEEELMKMRIHDLTVMEQLEAMPFKLEEIAAGKTARSERKMKRKDGTLTDVEISAKIIGPDRFLAFVRDISERKKAEEDLLKSREDLRRLGNYIENVREEERLNISREIHDELGQQLTVLKMDISRLGKKLATNEGRIPEDFIRLLESINNMVETVRKISSALRPGLLDDIGLSAALDWYCHDFNKKTGIKATFVSSVADDKFPKRLNICLFRIFQESLTNVVRHSEATKADISLMWQDQQLVLTIEDNGKGFDPHSMESNTLGIMGMRERAMMVGGIYNIYSTPGNGTITEVVIPHKNVELIETGDSL